MEFYELLIIAVGLSMDAFAVSICKGLSLKKMSFKNAVTAGAYFGGFQALMPLIGFWSGRQFRGLIASFDHWIAFILLAFIGANMIWESRKCCPTQDASFGVKKMIPLAVATSIDALAVGITFAFLNVDIVPAVGTIGITTFLFSFAGVALGHLFGSRLESKAEIAGGVILILIGLKILLSHLGIIGF